MSVIGGVFCAGIQGGQMQACHSSTSSGISVIVPAYNAEHCIHACLSALNKQSIARNRYEIIVVDDGSPDATANAASGLCDRVIRTDNCGPASARNTGVRNSGGSVLLFTDADCIPVFDWIETMTRPFDNPEVSGVKGAYKTVQTEWVALFVQTEYEFKYRRLSGEKYIDFIDTYSAGFRRCVFDDLGGFDESYPGASVEDQEFSFRAARAGYKMVFVPDAFVIHSHADTLSWYYRKKKNIGFWKVLVLKRHPSKTVKDSHTPQGLKVQLPSSILTVVTLLAVPVFGVYPYTVSVALFLLAGWGEMLHCYRRNGLVPVLKAPLAMWVRSIALSIGLISGLYHFRNMSEMAFSKKDSRDAS